MNRRPPLVFNTFGTNVVSTFAYAYDALSRRTQRLDTTDSALTTNTFSYNIRSELIGATMGTNTYSYAYDPIGNRQQTVENGLTNHYTANALNQYTALNPASTNPTPFTYDPDGNMTSDGTWSYAWDAENRLIEVQPLVANLGSTLVQYMYDAQSRRIARREFSWNVFSGVTNWYYVQGRAYRYDGWNLLHELKPPATPRTPPSYIPQTNLYLTGVTGPVAAQYVWGLDLSGTLHSAGGIGGLLLISSNTTNAVNVYDANGNVVGTMDCEGNMLDLCAYDSFGNEISGEIIDSGITPFRFSTKVYERAFGVYHFGYRVQLPKVGRWLSRDPLGELSETLLYAFVANTPNSQIDPLGLASVELEREENLDWDAMRMVVHANPSDISSGCELNFIQLAVIDSKWKVDAQPSVIMPADNPFYYNFDWRDVDGNGIADMYLMDDGSLIFTDTPTVETVFICLQLSVAARNITRDAKIVGVVSVQEQQFWGGLLGRLFTERQKRLLLMKIEENKWIKH